MKEKVEPTVEKQCTQGTFRGTPCAPKYMRTDTDGMRTFFCENHQQYMYVWPWKTEVTFHYGDDEVLKLVGEHGSIDGSVKEAT